MRVAVVTSLYVVSGDIQIGDQRLSDFLGNLLTSTVRLTGVTLARLADPDHVVASHAEIMIPGREVILGMERETSAGPRSSSATVVKKYPHHVFLASFPVEIEGTVHALSPTQLDMKEMLTTSADRFLPVTNAVVTITAPAPRQLRAGAVMVNARRLSYLARLPTAEVAQPN